MENLKTITAEEFKYEIIALRRAGAIVLVVSNDFRSLLDELVTMFPKAFAGEIEFVTESRL